MKITPKKDGLHLTQLNWITVLSPHDANDASLLWLRYRVNLFHATHCMEVPQSLEHALNTLLEWTDLNPAGKLEYSVMKKEET